MAWWGWFLAGMGITFVIFSLVFVAITRIAMRKMGISLQTAIATTKMMRGNNRAED